MAWHTIFNMQVDLFNLKFIFKNYSWKIQIYFTLLANWLSTMKNSEEKSECHDLKLKDIFVYIEFQLFVRV